MEPGPIELPEKIVFELEHPKTDTQFEPQQITFDPRILLFHIEFLSNNHNEPYPIPSYIATGLQPFKVMEKFIEAHDYSPDKIKVNKPITSAVYEHQVDPITFHVLAKYSDEHFASEAAQVIQLAEFIRFKQLSDAVSAAVATNYFISEEEKSLDDFLRKHGLEDISSEQICQIIDLYEGPFKLIEYKAKQQIMKLRQQQEQEMPPSPTD